MLAIPFIWYILFCYKPMGGVIIAFQKYSIFKGITGSKFVGLDNFKFVFGMRDFGIALGSTLLLNFMDLVFGFPMPIGLSLETPITISTATSSHRSIGRTSLLT